MFIKVQLLNLYLHIIILLLNSITIVKSKIMEGDQDPFENVRTHYATCQLATLSVKGKINNIFVNEKKKFSVICLSRMEDSERTIYAKLSQFLPKRN